jgi:alanine racemase
MFSWIEINKNYLKNNLSAFKKHIGNKVRLMPVVKSNAYGHGLREVGKICDDSEDVFRLCVASLEEAIELSKIRVKKPIQILSFYDLDFDIISELVFNHEIIFTVYLYEQITFLNEVGERIGKRIKVHLKVDAGTTRTGFLAKDVLKAFSFITKKPFLEIEGIWTHFASSEEDENFTMTQLDAFKRVLASLYVRKISPIINHSACTAATILYPQTHLNAVRVGLGVYGLYPNKESVKKINLKSIMSVNTKVIQIKEVLKNTSVSYGRTFFTKSKSTIAVLPFGYYDGYDRRLSNQGEVLLHGLRCSVLGRICMNLMMVDVTKIKKKIRVGDTVTLLGTQGVQNISADELAEKIDDISYEVITGFGKHLPKKIV